MKTRREWIQRTFKEGPGLSVEEMNLLQLNTGLSRATLQVCINRGLSTAESISEFLNPRLDQLASPNLLKDMSVAVERCVLARSQQQKIRIYGDYDVDGTTGGALLFLVLKEFGFQVSVEQPDRFKDGYGLNIRAVEEAHREGIQCLITVDCGITSFLAAQKAKELGIDLIIIDHHQCDPVQGLPAAFAVINPQRPDCTSGLKYLCGCGLAFYFLRALRTKGRELGWWQAGEEPNLKQHLDLVVIATAADMVPLIGDNHILVQQGMEVLKQSKKYGVRALLEVAGVKMDHMSPSHLGFVIGPRINATGRLASASLAMDLLTTKDEALALSMAYEIESLNRERAELQNKIWDEVRVQVEVGIQQGLYRHGILIGHRDWHEGVVGIVASRVTETFKKPAAVISIREDLAKGSVRSYGGKDVLEALRECSSLLKNFGGHKFAAGCAFLPQNYSLMVEAFDQAVEKLKSDSSHQLNIDYHCEVHELNHRVLEELEKLGPYGPGHPEPVFAVRAQGSQVKVLKERHLKFQLSRQVEAVWFNAAENNDWKELKLLEQTCHWAGVPELNRFAGRVTPTLRIRDYHLLENETT